MRHGERTQDLPDFAGFFHLAIAAPSMKAALEAWGADNNLFHRDAAKESDNPDIIETTMAAPGVVLKRPVGPDGPFREHAELPTDLAGGSSQKTGRRQPRKPSKRANDDAADRKAALALEKEQKRRERQRAKEEAARQKEREWRQHARRGTRASASGERHFMHIWYLCEGSKPTRDATRPGSQELDAAYSARQGGLGPGATAEVDRLLVSKTRTIFPEYCW